MNYSLWERGKEEQNLIIRDLINEYNLFEKQMRITRGNKRRSADNLKLHVVYMVQEYLQKKEAKQMLLKIREALDVLPE